MDNLQLSAAIARAHLNDLADFFDQAGEHDDPLLKSDPAMKRASLPNDTRGNATCHLRSATIKLVSFQFQR